ncbi:MAG: hypothetical protein M1368_02265 [Thaumarchaeota archaeon]|nr:hypothetical protein [Nitrososphaerota archaeon]
MPGTSCNADEAIAYSTALFLLGGGIFVASVFTGDAPGAYLGGMLLAGDFESWDYIAEDKNSANVNGAMQATVLGFGDYLAATLPIAGAVFGLPAILW